MNQKKFTSVLPSSSKANFEIVSSKMLVEIDKKLHGAIYKNEYKLKKVAKNTVGDDCWVEGTSSDKSKLVSALDHKGGGLKTSLIESDGKNFFKVEFLKELAIGDEISFSVTYTRPLLRKEVETGFLFKRYLIFVESIYANLCQNLEINFKLANEKCTLLESIPNRYLSEGNIISFKKDLLRPHEVYTVGLLLEFGLLKRRESKVLSSLLLMIVGAFVSLGVTKVFG